MRAATHPLPSDRPVHPLTGPESPRVAARASCFSQAALAALALVAVVLSAAGLTAQFAPSTAPTTVLVLEQDGTAMRLHRGTVQQWHLSGGVMQLAYVRDDIFTGSFEP